MIEINRITLLPENLWAHRCSHNFVIYAKNAMLLRLGLTGVGEFHIVRFRRAYLGSRDGIVAVVVRFARLRSRGRASFVTWSPLTPSHAAASVKTSSTLASKSRATLNASSFP